MIAVALFFGRASGLYATLLSCVAALYFLLPSRESAAFSAEAMLVPLASFLMTGCVVSITIDALHRANDRAAIALARAEKAERLREMLMREMSHRIKNKLQFLAATFNMHARAGGDVKEIMRAASSRIGVIARVHDRLFDQAGERSVDAQGFVSTLCSDLSVSLTSEWPIAIDVEADPIQLDLDGATTVGILVTELVTNAAKHAFIGRERGHVLVRLRRIDGLSCELVVQDDGCGIRDGAPQGFGSKIIRVLVEQLRGTLQVTNAPGATFTIRFPVETRTTSPA